MDIIYNTSLVNLIYYSSIGELHFIIFIIYIRVNTSIMKDQACRIILKLHNTHINCALQHSQNNNAHLLPENKHHALVTMIIDALYHSFVSTSVLVSKINEHASTNPFYFTSMFIWKCKKGKGVKNHTR